MRTRSNLGWKASVGVVLVVAMGLLAFAASPAAAAGRWTRPTTLGAPKASWEAAVGVDPSGQAVAAWVQTNTVPYRVYASIRPAGSLTWGTPTAISTNSAWNPYQPMVRLDAAGDAFVAWFDNGGVFVAIHLAGGNWLKTESIGMSSLAGLAVDSVGNATILSGNGQSIYAVDRPAGGTWGAPVVVDSPSNLSAPAALAMTDDGQTVAVWETYDTAPDPEYRTNYVVHAARRASFGSSWGPAATLSTPLKQNYGHAVAVGMDAAGDAIVVGRQLTDDPNLVLQSVTQSAGGSWTAPVMVSTAGTDSGYPSLSVDAVGNVTVAWMNVSTGGVESSTGLIPANTWSLPTQISPVGVKTGYPAVSGNATGAVVITWPALNPSGSATKLQAVVRTAPTTAWQGAMVGVAKNSLSNGVTGVDGTGRAVTVWNETPVTWIGQTTRTSTYLP